ncbi:hypothetical protein I317_05718 [Kwoniella heveanensis CBS 569]|nr:hypothetical protein I317_05718 [Kwoniella heveanensis CBS 569]
MSSIIASDFRPLCRTCTRYQRVSVRRPVTNIVPKSNLPFAQGEKRAEKRAYSRHSATTLTGGPGVSKPIYDACRSRTSGHRPEANGPSHSRTDPKSGKRSSYRRLALTIFGIAIPTTSYLFFPGSQPITPHMYSNQPVKATKTLTPQHKLITVDIPDKSKGFFKRPYRVDGSLADVYYGLEGGDTGGGNGEVVIQHMMIKSPDIQIERPYTPINDPMQDGEVRMVVKRVRGGEVGRVVHSLKEGDQVGIRGPIPTFSIYPDRYDRIIMISTGTAISPFLQLLSKLPSPSNTTISKIPQLHLIHAKPLEGRIDWAAAAFSSSSPESTPNSDGHGGGGESPAQVLDASLIPSLQAKFGDKLTVTRIDPGYLKKEVVLSALGREAEAAEQQAQPRASSHGWASSWFGTGNTRAHTDGGDHFGNGNGNAAVKATNESEPRATSSGEEEKIMVLVCLPPALMRPLCGGMTPNLDQGELTGLLAEIGLRKDQVWKLE